MRGTTKDGVIGRWAINDKEIDLLNELLRVHPDGYWQSNSSNEKDLGAIKSYEQHVWELVTFSVDPHLLECRVVEDIYWAPVVH